MTTHEQFKQALGRFATGVCVVTYQNPETQSVDGVTISAFSSLSLEPAKVLFCLGNMGQCHENFQQLEHFAINMLSSEHKALAYQFAGRHRGGLEDEIVLVDGLPTIKNSLATLVCGKGNTYTEGDHDIIIGDVKQIILGDESLEPLLYFKSAISEDYQHVS